MLKIWRMNFSVHNNYTKMMIHFTYAKKIILYPNKETEDGKNLKQLIFFSFFLSNILYLYS